ncbi:YggT family protein [Cellulomonas massiliensis]|uniref:YggT family protein n=1 Tax=Cellulomonas massiliensis TaxID=1465811 RepID=UPI0002DCD7F8|nr:YggT family protein [Cellulomonas massiliensis]
MAIVASVLYLVVLVFLVLLFVRLVLDWVMIFARDWRPRGVMLVVAEATYTVTDPPLRTLRRVVPSVTLGTVRLDLAFTVLMILCFVLLAVLASLAT